MTMNEQTKRVAAWHHGGLASASAAMCTHPLDLLKVHLQTQQKAQLGLVSKYQVGKSVKESRNVSETRGGTNQKTIF